MPSHYLEYDRLTNFNNALLDRLKQVGFDSEQLLIKIDPLAGYYSPVIDIGPNIKLKPQFKYTQFNGTKTATAEWWNVFIELISPYVSSYLIWNDELIQSGSKAFISQLSSNGVTYDKKDGNMYVNIGTQYKLKIGTFISRLQPSKAGLTELHEPFTYPAWCNDEIDYLVKTLIKRLKYYGETDNVIKSFWRNNKNECTIIEIDDPASVLHGFNFEIYFHRIPYYNLLTNKIDPEFYEVVDQLTKTQ